MNQSLYSGRIAKVKFSLSGADTVKKDSFVSIVSHDLFRNNQPFPQGAYDAHQGTTDHSYKCQTCYNSKNLCPGHEARLVLNYPVVNPIAITEIRRWLKLICFTCGHPILANGDFMNLPRDKRFEDASKIARTGNRKCHYCKTPHPTIKKNKIQTLALDAALYDDKRLISSDIIYPHQIETILSRVSDETVVRLGRKVESRPSNFTLREIKIPSVVIRPDVKKMGGGKSANDDLTTMIQMIIKKNDIMPKDIPAEIDNKLDKQIWELNNAYYDFIKAKVSEGSNTSIASRLKGKQGRFRKNIMGKRVAMMCRSTIIGDPQIQIDEVGIPLSFAKTIQLEDTVQEYNKAELLKYVQNGPDKYPGASKIKNGSTGIVYDIKPGQDYDIECGDVIYRDMIDGDVVNFNRQPSMKVSNISTNRAKIILNPNIKTLIMNVISTPFYDADFDGDAMNLIIVADIASRNEITEMSGVANWFVSHMNSSPAIGQVEDSVIGIAKLTRTNVEYNKYHAMLLYQNTTWLPDFTDITDKISGRAALSKLLSITPINFTRTTEWYKPNMAAFVNYDPTEIKVVIDRGQITAGILDKTSISKGANGGIYHIIANEYGAKKALDTMYNMQQIGIAHIGQAGFTVGIMDLLIDLDTKKEIDRIGSDIINQSLLLTEKLHNGEIIPPIGQTIDECYEEKQINILKIFDDFTEPILKAINLDTNNLSQMMMFGSKGSIANIFNMISSIGQKVINDERIRQSFGFKRTLAYFPRFDTSPLSRGYTTNSYLGGMNSQEYVFNAMAARFELITKALSTSITGEQNRKSIKNLESIIINNFRWATKNQNILELAYGEDFLDPRYVEKVKFPTVMISDAEFNKYKHKDYPAFAEQMENDRRVYREIFLAVEDMNVKELITDERHVPVNVGRIVGDVLREYKDSLVTPDKKTLDSMVNVVNDICGKIPYLAINEIQEKLGSAIPEYIKTAVWLLTMLIRSHLHPNALVNSKITPDILFIIIDKIRLRYSQALVDPGTAVGIIAAQSFSGPLTQYMLDAHHRSASGGTSTGVTMKLSEVLGAKPVSSLKNPTILIPIIKEYENNKVKVQEIANNIEVMRLHQFVTLWQVFFEKYGEPIHPLYSAESVLISEFMKVNPLLNPPGDLIRWCIRMVLNKTSLILKNMSLELIISKLRETFPDIFIVYTPENSKQIILRIYMKNSLFKSTITTNTVLSVKESLLNTIIRGIEGINNADVVEMLRNRITDDGSITRAKNVWGIRTSGTNMRGVMCNRYIDTSKIHTDAIQEMYSMFGIEAARQKVISEIRDLVPRCNHRHYIAYANEMTYTGLVTSIETAGLKQREPDNILLRVGYSAPIGVLEEAAITCTENTLSGITAPLLVGSIPRHGTLMNSFHVDAEFVQKNMKKPDDWLEDLM